MSMEIKIDQGDIDSDQYNATKAAGTPWAGWEVQKKWHSSNHGSGARGNPEAIRSSRAIDKSALVNALASESKARPVLWW